MLKKHFFVLWFVVSFPITDSPFLLKTCFSAEAQVVRGTCCGFKEPVIKKGILTVRILRVKHPDYPPIEKDTYFSALKLAKELFNVKFGQDIVFEDAGEKDFSYVWNKIYKVHGKEMDASYEKSLRNNFWTEKQEELFPELPALILRMNIDDAGIEQEKLMYEKEIRDSLKTTDSVFQRYRHYFFLSVDRARKLLKSKTDDALKRQSMTYWEIMGMHLSQVMGAQIILVNFPLMPDGIKQIVVIGNRNLPYYFRNVLSFSPLLKEDSYLCMTFPNCEAPEGSTRKLFDETKVKILADVLVTSFVHTYLLYSSPVRFDDAEIGCVTQLSGSSYFGEERYNQLIQKGKCDREAEQVKAHIEILKLEKEIKHNKKSEDLIYSIATAHKDDKTVLYRAFSVFLNNKKMEKANNVVQLALGTIKNKLDRFFMTLFTTEYQARGMYDEAIGVYKALLEFNFDKKTKEGFERAIIYLQKEKREKSK